MLMLGIESSCDETALAIVRDDGTIIAQELFSQINDHAPYGGVVPEIAARAHSAHIDGLAERLFTRSGLTLADMDGIAATAGPGLIGGVIVGLMTAKAYALVAQKPLYAINHLEGHALSVRLEHKVAFPYLLFLMSGGHCQILLVRGVGQYDLIGQTIDDAIGEAFDKTAKMMGLGYPGGPAIEALAIDGNAEAFVLPRPYLGKDHCDMSFSGLKTAVRTHLVAKDTAGGVSAADKADMAASVQTAIGDIVLNRLEKALELCAVPPTAIVVAGGVAANSHIRVRLDEYAATSGIPFIAPSLALCTDNAAMIAWAATERVQAGHTPDPLTTEPRARWPLVNSCNI